MLLSPVSRSVRNTTQSLLGAASNPLTNRVKHRAYSTAPAAVFNRYHKMMQRNRAAASPESPKTDYLKDAVAEALCDRLVDITRKFPKVLDLGSGPGHIARFIPTDRVDSLIQIDSSEGALMRDVNNKEITDQYQLQPIRLLADEEFLPFAPKTFDAVLSCLSLHWVNDLPGVFRQVRGVLKDDSCFLGAMFCGDTLFELRCSLQLAEQERKGGFSPHISPMVHTSDIGSLLTECGFTLLTVDADSITVNYPGPMEVMQDLKWMGESNALNIRQGHLSRDTLLAACGIYQAMYGNEDGTVPATFDLVYFIGWTPGKNQPKPAKRGSGNVSMKDLDKVFAPKGSDPKQ